MLVSRSALEKPSPAERLVRTSSPSRISTSRPCERSSCSTRRARVVLPAPESPVNQITKPAIWSAECYQLAKAEAVRRRPDRPERRSLSLRGRGAPRLVHPGDGRARLPRLRGKRRGGEPAAGSLSRLESNPTRDARRFLAAGRAPAGFGGGAAPGPLHDPGAAGRLDEP